MENKISGKPDFSGWVNEALRHWDRIFSKIKSKYWHILNKFWIQVSRVKEPYEIYMQSRTDFCTKVIKKKMKNICLAFEKIDGVKHD